MPSPATETGCKSEGITLPSRSSQATWDGEDTHGLQTWEAGGHGGQAALGEGGEGRTESQ